jgi:hypothetical protein
MSSLLSKYFLELYQWKVDIEILHFTVSLVHQKEIMILVYIQFGVHSCNSIMQLWRNCVLDPDIDLPS